MLFANLHVNMDLIMHVDFLLRAIAMIDSVACSGGNEKIRCRNLLERRRTKILSYVMHHYLPPVILKFVKRPLQGQADDSSPNSIAYSHAASVCFRC